ncbi:WD-repeat containing protein [Leptomonas pyrrhocoris]|uniref:Probable cytosolic iron-sulfur protein assembly protein CIAO1 homolog n=1 Tax=Leptomonas pyrrhocoris TaxID=157538 RepID=A0A0M9FTP8_LEPPY|nr:WD-repeat containing protein [Leptomonas pyrrhocoris]KPA75880.1 WD-repeat containing protein [Leptomonas pyrrhocoris]|eukprot:XP_015654319.1 WD-repeat containing protein [Leptomonas pyrrhocoris]
MATTAATASAAPLRLPPAAPPNVPVRRVATLKGHQDRVWCVRWCPTAAVLASCSGDATVRFWSRRPDAAKSKGGSSGSAEEEEWACIGTLEGEHSRTVRHISWSPSGEYIACASFDHTATVWRRDVDSGAFAFEIEGVLDGHESEVKCVEWATDSMLITSSRDHTAWIWERVDEGEYECGGVLTGHVQDVKHCQFILPSNDHDVPLAVTCGYDNTVKIWSEGHHQDDWQCTQTLTAHEATVWATALQKLEVPMDEVRVAHEVQALLPQPLLCSCSDDLSVIFWKRNAEGRFVEVSRASGFAERSLFDLDWAPHNASVVACASGDNSFTLLGVYAADDGVHSCIVARVADAHLSDVNSVNFASHGSLYASAKDADGEGGVLLASGGDDRVIHLWRVHADAE